MAIFKTKISCDEFMGLYVSKTDSISKMTSSNPSIVALGYLGLDMLFSVHYRKYVATSQHFKLIKAIESMHDSKWKNAFETSKTVNSGFSNYLAGAPGLERAWKTHEKDILLGYRIGRSDRPLIINYICNHIYAAAVSETDLYMVYNKLAAQLTSLNGKEIYLEKCRSISTNLISEFKVK